MELKLSQPDQGLDALWIFPEGIRDSVIFYALEDDFLLVFEDDGGCFFFCGVVEFLLGVSG